MPESKSMPTIRPMGGGIVVPYNVTQVSRETENGGTEIFYVFEQMILNQKDIPGLQQVKKLVAQKLDEERDRRIARGMFYQFPDGKTGTIQLRNLNDKTNVQGLGSNGLKLQVSGDTTTTNSFRDAENVQHEMNGEQLVTMGVAVSGFTEQLYKDCWAKKDELKSLNTEDAVVNYDFSGGWTY